MRTVRPFVIAASITMAALAVAAPAQAGSGDALLGGVAGFAVGTLFGNAVAQPRYVMPAPVYVRPAPVYAAPPPVIYEAAPVYYELEPWTPDWYSYCASRYRSFDARSGTFVDYGGRRQMCR